MSSIKFCPNCVSEMQIEKRGNTKVLVCSDKTCGVRVEVEDVNREIDEEQRLRDRQRKRDARGYYDSEGHNTY